MNLRNRYYNEKAGTANLAIECTVIVTLKNVLFLFFCNVKA